MIKLRLPAPLVRLLPSTDRSGGGHHWETVLLDVSSWAELTKEMRDRFPLLADQVLTEDGRVRRGFILVVDDEVMSSRVVDLAPDSEVCLVAAVAGG
jgi:hypothetical protein